LRFVLSQHLNLKEGMTGFLTRSLQFDFYLSRHPEIEREDLMFMDKSDIFRTDIKSKEVKAFVEQRMREQGLVPKKKYMDNVDALYREATENRMQRVMERRNRVVSDYLTRSLHLPETACSVVSDSLPVIRQYAGRNGYQIGLILDGEIIEGSDSQSSADAAE
ncbi:MAG: hypothetical protein J6Z12_00460, partial [Paludibacteraceae bacterium]|nr:hypothetical protein [Paludibacteraceae bacterium]